jgi:hypothetical protein
LIFILSGPIIEASVSGDGISEPLEPVNGITEVTQKMAVKDLVLYTLGIMIIVAILIGLYSKYLKK